MMLARSTFIKKSRAKSASMEPRRREAVSSSFRTLSLG